MGGAAAAVTRVMVTWVRTALLYLLCSITMYFDNAATTFPKPECVYEAQDAFFRRLGANPGRSGHRMAAEAAAEIARTRMRLARLLHAPDPNRVVWAANCTEALNLALRGLLRPGDTVVTTALEHNAVARPLRALERRGITLNRVSCPGGRFDLHSFIEAIGPDTGLVAMIHVSNVTGEVLPVAEVGAVCRSRGVPFLVDAAQSVGHIPMDVREIGCDLLAVSGHKGLLGPPGTGALYVAPGVDLEPLKAGGTGSASEDDEQPTIFPDRFESGTQNSVGIAGLGAAVQWILDTGVETLHARETRLLEQLWEGLVRTAGVTLYGPSPGASRAAIISFNVDGWEPEDAAGVLDEQFDIQCRSGLHCAPWAHRSVGTYPGGTIRVSPGYFNTEKEVDAVVRAVSEVACGKRF